MVLFEHNLFFDEAIFKLFNERQYNKSFKKALNYAMNKWHKERLPAHFERSAYTKYRASYGKRKKTGNPMVRTGQFKKNILNRIEVRGTAKKVSGKVFFGTPRPKTKKELTRYAWAIVNTEIRTFKEALKIASRRQGNYAKNNILFENQISAINADDVQQIKIWINDFMLNEFKTVGRKRKAKKITTKKVA